MIPYLIMFIHFTETVANNKTPHWTVFNQQDQKLKIYHLISFMRFKWIRWNVTWINRVSIFVYFLKLKSGNLFLHGKTWCWMLSPTPPSLRFPPDSFNNVSQGQTVRAQGPLGGTQVSINSLVPYSLQGLEQGPVAAQKENGPLL